MRDDHTIKLHTGYGWEGERNTYTQLDDILSTAVHNLTGVDFDTMVGTGMSGAIVIPVLAREMGKHFLIIRKPGVDSHDTNHVGVLGERWIFVDDFISDGGTKDRVKSEVEAIVRHSNMYRPASLPRFHTTYVGDYLYANNRDRMWRPA